MRFFLLACSLLLSSGGALAADALVVKPAPLKYFVGLNLEARLERDSSQQYVFRGPFGFNLGMAKANSWVMFEYERFGESSGNNTLSVQRTHNEYTFWLNYHFQDALDAFRFFASLGAGAYQEEVRTALNGNSVLDHGDLQGLLGLGGGIRWTTGMFTSSLEGRFIAGQNYDPNPQFGAVVKVGLLF